MTRANLYDRAREAVAASGFDADTQTRIALFVGAAKCVHATLLAAAELLPSSSIVYPFMHGQYYREVEFASLLARVTRWSANPLVYGEASALAAPLWKAWWRIQGPLGTLLDARAAYRGLALGHALLAVVRLAPVIPDDVDGVSPFVAALRRIEQENGRMIQAQVRLLKDAPVEMTLAERGQAVEEEQAGIEQAFVQFLERLAGANSVLTIAAPAQVAGNGSPYGVRTGFELSSAGLAEPRPER